MSLPPEIEHDLIARIQQGHHEASAAFDRLYAAYDRQIYGFICGRTHDDQHAQQIAQDTRIQVWAKMATYDATRGRFPAFAKYWAGFMLLRYYTAQQQQHTVEIIFSELQRRYPDLPHEQDMSAILARVAAHKEPSVEEQTLRVETETAWGMEVHEELLRLIFGGANPPHQAIAVGFRNLVEPETSEDIQDAGESQSWPPRKIVRELSDTSLTLLEQRLEGGYVHASHLPKERVHDYFTWLRHSMQRQLGEVMTDQLMRQTHATLLPCRVGPMTLRHFYTHQDNPAQDIIRWCESVKKRVWSAVKRQGMGALYDLLQARRYQAGRQHQQAND